MLPLPHFAHVMAALDEGFSLDEVLAVEGVDPATWTLARNHHVQAIAADPLLLVAYREALVEARDRFAREVAPLDADLEAWVAFLRDPERLAEQYGLRAPDIDRLTRRWAARARADEALAARADALAKQTDLPVVDASRVRVAAAQLVPSPFASAVPAESEQAALQEPEPAVAEERDLSLDRYAALLVDREIGVTDDEVRRKYGVEDLQALDRHWQAALAEGGARARDLGTLKEHYRRKRRETHTVEPAAEPFVARPRPPQAAAPPDATAFAFAPVVVDAPLPFARASDDRQQDVDATAVPDADVRAIAPLPFVAGDDGSASLDGTSFLDAALRDEPATPWSPRRPQVDITSPEHLPAKGGTKAVDVDKAAESPTPFVAATLEGVPQLTVQQYASYRTDLATDPGARAAIQLRYGVASELAHAQLEGLWTKAMEASPDLSLAFVRACRDYKAWRAGGG